MPDGLYFAIAIFAADEKEICHNKFFFDDDSIVFNAVPIISLV